MRVVLIGVGGATCTGKTTLAKHLRNCLPGCYIAHQDDFAPPVEKIPIHPEYNVQDWDDAPGAIDWPRLRSSLAHIKATGKLPDSHTTHDHWNKQTPVPIREETIPVWLKQFEDIAKDKDEDIQYVILEGFLLYWDKEVMDQIDVRIMLRIPHDVLRQRREGDRREYITAVSTGSEGDLWQDPPGYWDQIVYPAYIRSHKDMFEGEDVEKGEMKEEVKKKIVLLDGMSSDLQELLDRSCQAVLDFVRSS